MDGNAAFVLQKTCEAQTRFHGAGAQPLDHGVVQHLLKPAAVNRKLGYGMTAIGPAEFPPYLLALAVQVDQLVGANTDVVQGRQKANLGKLTDSSRQRVDADTDFPDFGGLFVDLGIDATTVEHESQGEPPDSGAGDNDFHDPTSCDAQFIFLTSSSHSASGGGRKSISCLADTATISAGSASAMLWSCQKRS